VIDWFVRASRLHASARRTVVRKSMKRVPVSRLNVREKW
jgi:hypothetical protein